MGILERIKEIKAEMAHTQKNKATEYHLGQLKAKLAKLRTKLLEPPKGSSGAGEGFEVTKYGHGRVALIGFPSVGKSTLLTMLTGTHSEAASYEFTTLTCIPGITHYNDSKIQLLDLQGIIEDALEGKGRGRQVIAVSKSSDIVLMVLDASKSEGHRQILTRELEAVGLRLNKRPPQGNRKYMKCIYVYNKIDVVGIDDVDRLARQPNSIVISCSLKDRGGCTVEDFSNHIHRSLIKDVKYVLEWGTSARHYPSIVVSVICFRMKTWFRLSRKKEKEDGGGRGRFKSYSNATVRISD